MANHRFDSRKHAIAVAVSDCYKTGRQDAENTLDPMEMRRVVDQAPGKKPYEAIKDFLKREVADTPEMLQSMLSDVTAEVGDDPEVRKECIAAWVNGYSEVASEYLRRNPPPRDED